MTEPNETWMFKALNSDDRDVKIEGVSIKPGKSAEVYVDRIGISMKRITVKIDGEVKAERTYIDPDWLEAEILLNRDQQW